MKAFPINEPILCNLKIASNAMSGLVFCIGAISLAGWIFDIAALKSLHPSLPPIAPISAVLLMASGLAVCLLNNGKRSSQKRSAANLLAFFILSASSLTYIECLFDINIGLDYALFPEKIQTMSTPGRMSLQSIINFLVVGLSVMLFDKSIQRKFYISQFIILITGAISFISLLGYIYGFPHFYTIPPFKGMSALASTAFLLIFFAVLLARPDQLLTRTFINRGISAYVSRRLFTSLLVLTILDILVMLAGRFHFYNPAFRPMIHLWLIVTVFIYLIYVTFNSMDKVAQMEETVTRLKEIDRAKDEFISTASHQLRTPLSSISWHIEMLLSKNLGKTTSKQRNHFLAIAQVNRHMISIVNDLLHTSRINTGKLVVRPEPVDCNLIIAKAAESVTSESEARNVKLKLDLDENLPFIIGDQELIYAAIENLIVNAIRYNRPRGTVTVATKTQGEGVKIHVSDTGIGIPQKMQAKVFSKLFRAENAKKQHPNGSGLGLYITKAIVERHGGRIGFRSKARKGTDFFFTLNSLECNNKRPKK